MSDMLAGLVWIFGQEHSLTALQMGARGVAFFFITLILIRLSGRRSFGQRTAFDASIAIMLGAVLSRAVVGATPVVATISAALALVVTHRLMAWLSVRYPIIARLMDGEARQLVDAGAVSQSQMRRALLTPADLDEARRQHGLAAAHVTEREQAWLERSGKVSIIKKAASSPKSSSV